MPITQQVATAAETIDLKWRIVSLPSGESTKKPDIH